MAFTRRSRVRSSLPQGRDLQRNYQVRLLPVLNPLVFTQLIHRLQVGTLLIHVGVRRGDRRAALEAITKCAIPSAVRDAMAKWVVKEGETHSLARVLIASVAAFSEETSNEPEKAEKAVISSLVLAHNMGGQATWIDMCRRGGVDPSDVVARRGSDAVAIVCDGDEVCWHSSISIHWLILCRPVCRLRLHLRLSIRVYLCPCSWHRPKKTLKLGRK